MTKLCTSVLSMPLMALYFNYILPPASNFEIIETNFSAALVLVDLAAEDGEAHPLEELGLLLKLRLLTAEQVEGRPLGHRHTGWGGIHRLLFT